MATSTGLGALGNMVQKIGNASSGVIPQGMAIPGGSAPVPYVQPHNVTGPIASTNPGTTGGVAPVTGPSGAPVATPTLPGGITQPAGTVPLVPGGGIPINGTNYNNLYGSNIGNSVTGLLEQENGLNNSQLAQNIIQANAPNVAQGQANLDTGLAASGISPSSSVSAIENANYQAQVQQQNLATETEVGLTEQERQQQLLETLLPGQQQQHTEGSGWSIFGDVLSGIGSIFGL